MEKEEEEKKSKEKDAMKVSTTKIAEDLKEQQADDNMLYTCDLLEGLAMKRAEVIFKK